MPIRPEDRAKYPQDWPAISRRIRERAGQCCEQCKAPNGKIICRMGDEYSLPRPDGEIAIYSAEDGLFIRWASPHCSGDGRCWRPVRVVLTVAHLDHNPENCSEENLRALCQRCHLRHDSSQHKETRRRTKDERSGQRSLFQ